MKSYGSPKRSYLAAVVNRQIQLTELELAAPTTDRLAYNKEQECIRLAREDSAYFAEYILTDEATGKPVEGAEFHKEWHQHFEDHKRVVLFASVEHAKTSHAAIARVLRKLGENPNCRVALVSNTATQAEKLLSAVRSHIKNNRRLHSVYPNLRRKSGLQWTNKAITIERPSTAKDPSVQALGIGGPINGSRVDHMVLDDVCDFENTRTPAQRQLLVDWWDTTASTRITPGGTVTVIGTPWHDDDLLNVLARRPGFFSAKYPAVLNPGDPQDQWKPLWPARFSVDRLKDIYASTTVHAFSRKYLCEVRNDETSRFATAWWLQMLAAGKGWNPFGLAPRSSGQVWPCFTGVDLGVGQSEGHDMTVLATVAFEPGTKKRVLCEIQAGRWEAPEIVNRIRDTHARFGSICVVESNAAQKFIQQFATHQGIPVRPYFTSAGNKYNEHFGVESLAVEMASGLWRVPSGKDGATINSEFSAFWRECQQYTPEDHTGDRLMAVWLAREAARNYAPSIFAHHQLQRR